MLLQSQKWFSFKRGREIISGKSQTYLDTCVGCRVTQRLIDYFHAYPVLPWGNILKAKILTVCSGWP